MVRCYIALGGNMGSVSTVFGHAIAELQEHPALRVAAVSRYHRTAAVGAAAETGGDFLNGALGLDTELPPLALLELLQELENKHGRVREVHWGPRTLDLDLLFYGNEILELPRLVVPHPAAWFRRFVLDPLCDIAPELVHPLKGLSIAALRDRLLPRPLAAALAGGTVAQRRELIERLQPEFPQVAFSSWLQATSSREPCAEPALIVWLGETPEDPIRYEQLPVIPRIPAGAEPDEMLRSLLQAALG